MKDRIVVAGGSGFIGRILTNTFVTGDNDVVVLTRSPGATSQPIQVQWDGRTLSDWARELDGARGTSQSRRPVSELPIQRAQQAGDSRVASRFDARAG